MQALTPYQAWLVLQRGEGWAGESQSFIVWPMSPTLPPPVPQPSEGWVMWVMESNRVQIVSVTVTLLYLVSAGSGVTHRAYWSRPRPTHLGHKWVYSTLITSVPANGPPSLTGLTAASMPHVLTPPTLPCPASPWYCLDCCMHFSRNRLWRELVWMNSVWIYSHLLMRNYRRDWKCAQN